MAEDALIVLSDGHIFYGKVLGKEGIASGEAVFNTGMNGYIETLTDPSYFGQIVIQTFPLIGNYGIIDEDFESSKPHIKGYVVRHSEEPSNFRSNGSLDDFLKKHGIIGIQGVDTRALTKILREKGVMNAMIVSGESSEAKELRKRLLDGGEAGKDSVLKEIASYKVENAVGSVSLDALSIEQDAESVFNHSAEYRFVPIKSDGSKSDAKSAREAGKGRKVVLWDFGAKENIRRELLKRGLNVVTIGSTASASDILNIKPSGIMLSNGPGDPEYNVHIIEELRKVLDADIPAFGICLGHQLMALALGAQTIKLKYGHRGANQPVKCLSTGRVYITSQNHGYAVSDNLPSGAILTYINTNDGTCEGLAYEGRRAFSVQFHPEACSGPLDTSFLFDDFVRLMDGKKAGVK